MKRTTTLTLVLAAGGGLAAEPSSTNPAPVNADTMEDAFRNPPDSARPGVYWYFMDGNLDRDEMIRDLDSMKEAGLGHVVYLEVNVDVPRGPVEALSPQWLDLFANAVHHAEKIGIDVTLGAGPGWTGSGGPWIKPEESMQHLVFSATEVKGPAAFSGKLPVAPQRDHWWKMLDCDFYEDVAVYAFPACQPTIEDADQKAFYTRPGYSSGHSPAFLPAPAKHAETPKEDVIDPGKIIVEPYEMTQTADLELGALADVPMCEFWSTKYDCSHAVLEAASVAHTLGKPVVSSEAFTGHRDEKGRHYPGSLKNQADWAFAVGVNHFQFHTFVHKPLGEEARPGMTMGPWGVRWDRGQTWWPMAGGFHRYLARCSHLLQQGRGVSDVLYLTPEGAPHVFNPPPSALAGSGNLPDKKGYSFDGCPPGILKQMTVRNGLVGVPGGTSYRLLVLPRFDDHDAGLSQDRSPVSSRTAPRSSGIRRCLTEPERTTRPVTPR